MKHVLLVEDDRWLAETFRYVIEKNHLVCHVATSAGEALERIDDTLPDVIVVDFLLPGVNVLPFLHELQSYEDSHAIPVIMCTTVARLQQEAAALERYGVRMVLDKAEITPKALVQAIKNVMVPV